MGWFSKKQVQELPQRHQLYPEYTLGDYGYFYNNTRDSVIIPEYANGYDIIRGFSSCHTIKSVDIQRPITSLKARLFYDCSLESIKLPHSLKTIENYCFEGCQRLQTINIPEGVESIGDWAFSDCCSLTTINLPSNLKVIGEYAFYRCTSLKSLYIPKSVNKIETLGVIHGVVYMHYCTFKNNIPDWRFSSTKKLVVSVVDSSQFWQLVEELNKIYLSIKEYENRLFWIRQFIIEIDNFYICYEDIVNDKDSIMKLFEIEQQTIVNKKKMGAINDPHRVTNNILNAVKYSYYKSL